MQGLSSVTLRCSLISPSDEIRIVAAVEEVAGSAVTTTVRSLCPVDRFPNRKGRLQPLLSAQQSLDWNFTAHSDAPSRNTGQTSAPTLPQNVKLARTTLGVDQGGHENKCNSMKEGQRDACNHTCPPGCPHACCPLRYQSPPPKQKRKYVKKFNPENEAILLERVQNALQPGEGVEEPGLYGATTICHWLAPQSTQVPLKRKIEPETDKQCQSVREKEHTRDDETISPTRSPRTSPRDLPLHCVPLPHTRHSATLETNQRLGRDDIQEDFVTPQSAEWTHVEGDCADNTSSEEVPLVVDAQLRAWARRHEENGMLSQQQFSDNPSWLPNPFNTGSPHVSDPTHSRAGSEAAHRTENMMETSQSQLKQPVPVTTRQARQQECHIAPLSLQLEGHDGDTPMSPPAFLLHTGRVWGFPLGADADTGCCDVRTDTNSEHVAREAESQDAPRDERYSRANDPGQHRFESRQDFLRELPTTQTRSRDEKQHGVDHGVLREEQLTEDQTAMRGDENKQSFFGDLGHESILTPAEDFAACFDEYEYIGDIDELAGAFDDV